MRRALPIAIAMFLSGLVSYAISRLDHPSPAVPTTLEANASDASAAPPPTTELDELARLDHDIAFYRHQTEVTEHDWLDWDYVAHAYMDRARLTGDYVDWQRAESALASAFAAGENGHGPYLSRAIFNFTMHRIDRVEADLDVVAAGMFVRASDRDAIVSLRGDVNYYGGHYGEARAFYEQLSRLTRRDADSLVLMAQLDWHTGHFDEAAALLDEALASPRIASAGAGAMRAWVLMTRATMERDRGRLDEALTRIEAARALVPDDPSFDEITAEIHEARGESEIALDLYRSIATATRTPQSIDGTARILRLRGDGVAADELVALARQSYDAQIALFPEAAYGHAIDHWLRLEPGDVERMLEIAQGNAAARPYGETRVKLAMAYLLTGRTTDARHELDEVLATEWSTAELHAVNALTLEREGQDGASERAAAEAIAPGVMDRLGWLSALPQ